MPGQKGIHPHKLIMWLLMASVIMMFAGLTSAYIVKRNQANWQGFDLPLIFWYSTAAIMLSSATLYMAARNFKAQNRAGHTQWMVITILLGVGFIVMQIMGFAQLEQNGIRLIGTGSNVSGSFLAVIAGLHLLHVLGGVITLLVLMVRNLNVQNRNYSAVPMEVISTYWHFIGALWLYLFVFLQIVS